MSKIRSLFFISVLSFATANCMAQGITINTDRPDQSDGVSTVPKNKFQIEDGATVAKRTFLNNLMLRYGITKSTEVRLLVDAGKDEGISGVKPVTLSAKQRIIQQHKIIPAITFVGYISFPKMATEDFQEDTAPYVFTLAFENELSNKVSLSYNVGTSNNFNDLNLTFNLGYAPAEKLSTFVEYFSTITEFKAYHNMDLGILFLIKKNLQFDVAAGHAIFDAENRFYATFGVAYLFGLDEA